MSYILDALKKSDSERKQGDVPDLQTVHIPVNVKQQTPWALYGFISVLLLVLFFVVGLVISGKGSITAIQEAEKNRQEESIADVPVVISAEERNVIKAVAPVKTSQQVIEKPEVVQVKNKALIPELQRSSVASVVSSTSLLDINNIPYLHEMPDYQQQSVPEMHFAGHVYSVNPVSRSVIINDYAMSEGDTLVQGINVVEITLEGVIFSLHNDYFRVDILQDWSFE